MAGLSSSYLLLLLPLLQAAGTGAIPFPNAGPFPAGPARMRSAFSALANTANVEINGQSFVPEPGTSMTWNNGNHFGNSYETNFEYGTATRDNDASYVVFQESTGEEPKGFAFSRSEKARAEALPYGWVDEVVEGEIDIYPDPNSNVVEKTSYKKTKNPNAVPIPETYPSTQDSPVNPAYYPRGKDVIDCPCANADVKISPMYDSGVHEDWNTVISRRALTPVQLAELEEEEQVAEAAHAEQSFQRRAMDPAVAAELDEEEAMEAGDLHQDAPSSQRHHNQRRSIDPAVAAELDEEEAMEAGNLHQDSLSSQRHHNRRRSGIDIEIDIDTPPASPAPPSTPVPLERRTFHRWGSPPSPPPPSSALPDEKLFPTTDVPTKKLKRGLTPSNSELPPININVFQLPNGDYVQDAFGPNGVYKTPQNVHPPPKPAHESVRGFQREFGWLYPDAHAGAYKMTVQGVPEIKRGGEEEVGGVKRVDINGLGDAKGDAIEVFEQWSLKSDVASNRGLVWIREKENQDKTL